MKKGFTLVELLATIIILGIVVMISYPTLKNTIKGSKEKLYNEQINRIEKAASDYLLDNNLLLNNNETKQITLMDLKKSGLLPVDIRNPKTKQLFSNQTIIKVTLVDNDYNFEVIPKYDEDIDKEHTGNAPIIELIGNNIETIPLNSNYVEKGVNARDYQGNSINKIDITYKKGDQEVTSIDTSIKTTYTIIYTVTDGNLTSSITRTVIVN